MADRLSKRARARREVPSGVDGLPIEDEAEIMSIALNYLDFVFDGIRREITEEPDESG